MSDRASEPSKQVDAPELLHEKPTPAPHPKHPENCPGAPEKARPVAELGRVGAPRLSAREAKRLSENWAKREEELEK